MTLSAMFIALGMILPFLVGQIPEIGQIMLPIHYPVILCGLICGPVYGLGVGLIIPILRSVMFGIPVMFPTAIAMSFELGTYGLISGLVFKNVKRQNLGTLYLALISSMIAGRAVWGLVMWILLSGSKEPFTMGAFLAGSFLNALPGILIQLILIPAIMGVLKSTGVIRYRTKASSAAGL